MPTERSNDEATGLGILDAALSTTREFVARYINTSADFAKQLVEFQALSTTWAKDTPMGPFFESQQALALDLIQFWASATRSLLRIEESASKSEDRRQQIGLAGIIPDRR